ncbi:alpha-(1-_6)-mannopyranosyltransferase A [Corynebacterium sp. USCH3]|uniref:alpha-(1->6)-mannopyranosyltransferase A n=1 Tax=Corynebacterium sp. USCH3 TaxID=3024840 RepID=UPI0030B6CF13
MLTTLATRVRDMPRRRAVLLGLLGSVLLALCSHSVGATRNRGGVLQALGWSNLGFGHLYGIIVVVMWIAILLMILSWIVVGGRVVRLGESLGLRPVLAWVAPLFFAGPLMSRDIYSYLMQGTLARDGFNAYEVGASANPGRMFFEVSGDWRNTTTPYGPLHLWIGEGVTRLTGDNITAGIILYKILSLASLAVLMWAVAGLARKLGGSPDTAVWIGVVNPLAVIHFIGGMHNEVTMMALVCTGLLLGLRGTPVRGLVYGSALIGAGVALKATALFALPFLVWMFVARRAGTLPGEDGPRRGARAVLRDMRQFSPARLVTMVVGGPGAAAVMLASVAVITWASGQTWGWVAEISGNTKVINPLSLASLLAGLLVRPLSLFTEEIYFNEIVAVLRPVTMALMLLGLVVCWLIWRRGPRDAVVGATAAYAVTCVLNAVVLPWYYMAPLALFGVWVRDRRALIVVAWVSMVLSMTFDGGGNNRLYSVWWLVVVGVAMWWVATACLRNSADGHGLGPSHDLPGEVPVERVDGAPRQ